MSAVESLALELSTIDDGRLLAIVGQLERLRDRAKIKPLIAPARPRLRELRPERRMTLQRLNCIPFEDVLVSNPGRAPAGRIAREAILPSWRIITEQAPRAFEVLDKELASGAPPERVANQLWSHAAEALRQVLERAEQDEVLRRQLRRERPSLEHELKTIYRYLATAEEIQRFKRDTGPAPLRELGRTELQQLREALGRVAASGGSALHLLMVAAARSADAERVLEVFAGGGEAFSALRKEAAIVIGGFLFGAIEHRMNAVAAIEEPRRLAETLGQLVAKLESTEELLQRDYGHGAADYEEEISAASALAREVVEHRLVPGARSAVEDVLTGLEDGGLSPASAAKAEDHVRALRHSRSFAARVGASTVVSLALQTLSREIEERSLRAVRKAASNEDEESFAPAVRRIAAINLAGAARLLELSSTSAAAHKLYRSGLKALDRLS